MTRILIVDDDERIRLTVRKVLEASGRYRVVAAANGKAGLRAAKWYEPDLIVLDIDMPKMNGLEMLRKLDGSAHTRFIPVVMLTASCDRADTETAIHDYAEDYLHKPVDMATLEARITDVLHRRRRTREKALGARPPEMR
jgi:DNA-binding response OmpR family regulator